MSANSSNPCNWSEVHKMAVAWTGGVGGWVASIYDALTLQQVVLTLTGIYSALQIVLLVYDRFMKKEK